ncbi:MULTISPECIES: filamentous hemagglutinin N-terminal domain-containing protein [unclassified Caballeronia]|uniref:two-partner secretion domain-containing protein n=1 Tax=unclassified Caballeronia TaxID=2646786 RepID=UPI002865C124|nr:MULTISPECIES: filamentous hemagglutinin N-terminal domain-containing protein [unclassified Caballeronia]MDR5753768.1 filamentous hemagglutinin N-terminal domain-containing protein [Caballeronia sp. LZ024]MDR5840147.1 filamentous hemagglutinin N-terminal domain-containing protein [Caballeronia sp. LZ031]
MNDNTGLRTRKHRRAWERAIRRLARRAARHAGVAIVPSLLPVIALFVAPPAFALPLGGQVASGNVTIGTPAPNTMAITQGTPKGIVNWNSFSIGANETVNIAQPSAQAVLLNRVVGSQASTIAGRMNANGQVFLVNPAGVLFARGASVNVGSLVASTLGISDRDFLAGRYRFASASPQAGGQVVNQGAITAGEHGTVALLGAQVDNSGTVSAKLGTVAMGAGSDITLDFAGDGLTMLKVNGAAAQALASNSGVLAADGGQVLMSVQTADALAATVLNQMGTVRAQSVAERNGRIVLDGGAAGVTEIAGNVDATGVSGLSGGQIDATGYHVAVNDGARIDASGAQGGGRVRVGGGAAGKETDIHNADAVWMGPGAQVRADALASGDGGNVVIYGTHAARVYGMLTAKGGAQSGNGGLVETSARFLDVAGAEIDASALHGVGGTWVLDPFNVTITTSTVDSGGGPNFVGSTNLSTVSVGTINARLNSGTSVLVDTGVGGEPGGDITLQGLINKNAGGPATLTLQAAGSIIADRTLDGSGGASIVSTQPNGTTGPLSVVLVANTAGSTNGSAEIVLRGSANNAPFRLNSNGGDVSIDGPVNGPAPRIILENASIDTRTLTVVTLPGSDPAVVIGENAPSGAITINGQAPVDVIAGVAGLGIGVDISNGSALQTTTGPITITGNGVTRGVSVGASDITATAGNVLLTGTSSTGIGIDMDSAALQSAAGAITVTGRGGAGGVSAQLGSMTADTGDITIDGTALASGAVARADGVSLFAEPIETSGGIFLRGAAASQGPMGTGVTIAAAGEGTFVLTSGLPGIRVYGSGNGYEGVSTRASSTSDTGRHVFFTSQDPAAPGPIDIRGVTNGALVTASGSDSGYHAGVRLANASLNGSNITLAGSVSGSGAPVEQNGLQIVDSTVGTLQTRTLTLRASNTGANTSSISVDAFSAFAVPAGTLQLLPGSVSPTTFAIAADDAAPINIGVPGATGGGFTLDGSFGGRFSSNIDSVYIGSTTHTGRITLGPTCAEPPCAGLPATTNLAVANGGTGSLGILLPSAISVTGLTLDSAGPVTQSAPLVANLLLLGGPGTFTLTNPGNSIGTVALVGTGDTSITGDGLSVGSGNGAVFDTRTNAFSTIDSNGRATLAGNLTLTSTVGDVTLVAPVENVSGHDITLDMRAADFVDVGNDITSAQGKLDIVANAPNEVFIGGVSNGSDSTPHIAVLTNGGSVNLSAAGRAVSGPGGPGGSSGAAVVIRFADVDTRVGAAAGAPSSTGGDVTARGIMPEPRNVEGSFAGSNVGVEVDGASIWTGSGSVQLVGQSLNPAVNPGGGVVIGNAAAGTAVAGGPAHITTTTGAIRIYGTGSGAGNYGVAFIDGSSLTTAGGPIDIRGSIASTGPGALSPTYGVLLLNGSINASAANGTVSIAGSTTTADAGIAYGAVPLPGNERLFAGPFSVTTGAQGVVTLRASNNGTATSLRGRSGAGTIDAQGGSLFISPASVDPSTFDVTVQNAVPITLFGTNATQGLSIDAATYQTFSTTLQTLVLGSSTQTGHISVQGACEGGSACAQRPAVATGLTLQNTGAGGQGIDLPSGISLPGKTLALASSGIVTDPGGIQAQSLLLAGGGDFTLTDAGNDVNTLALAGAHDVSFEASHGFTIGPVSAQGFDGATGRAATIDGTQSTVTGNLAAISDNGRVSLGSVGSPTHLSAGGSIDLVMQNVVFDNAAGGSLSAGNAWRVWARSRDQQENRGGIDPGGTLPNFYGCVYGGICSWNGQPSLAVVPGNSNHFVYAERPTLTVTIGGQTRIRGSANGPFGFAVSGLLSGDQLGSALAAGPLASPATLASPGGTYPISGTFSSPTGYNVVVTPGTLTVQDPLANGGVFNRSGLQPLFTAQEDSFVYESNLGGVNICVGTNEPILALQEAEGAADTLAAEWKRVRSRPNLNNCLVVNGQHGCGEF